MRSMWKFVARAGMAASLSLAALAMPATAMAGTVAVADGTNLALSFVDVGAIFTTGPGAIAWFAGAGVASDEIGLLAPVGQVSVNGTGPGAITIDWGASVDLYNTFMADLHATNFSLSVADKLIYADLTITAPDGGPTVSFTHLNLFNLTDLSGDFNGVALDQVVATNQPGLLNLNAKVFLNTSAMSQINVAFGALPVNDDNIIAVGNLVIGVGAQPIPEPGTWAMMGLGLAGLVAVRARRQRGIS